MLVTRSSVPFENGLLTRLLPCLLAGAIAAQTPDKTAERPAPSKPEPPAAMAGIGKEELLKHATFLASDELGGRLTGSPGQEMAAKYIADHFAGLGLEPLGDPTDEADGGRSFVQRYAIERTSVQPTTKLELGDLQLSEGFALLGGSAMDVTFVGDVRFCGFGRTRGDQADVPEAESLENKVAVVALRRPRGRVDGELSVEQKFAHSFSVFGQLGRTAKALAQKGAGVVLFVMPEDPIGFCDVLNYLALSPGKDGVVAKFPGADPGMGGLGRVRTGDAATLVLSVPASLQVMARLGVDAETFAAWVAGTGELPEVAADVPAKVRLEVAHDEQATASNVVALLRGSDPQLANEAIVYSAHMDHVGRRMDGEVFNGADDNASGSAGLLAIASAFANAEQRPRRSVIFLSVSGEELGLWGSQFFADNPTWPMEQIVADINTDMIGRSGPESSPTEVTVTPSYRHRHYSSLVRDAAGFAEQLGASFTDGDKYYQRSDHYNFAKKGVPVVFFCNGEHEDYHQVTDTADKLDGEKMQRIARLAFWTGWHTANADDRPRRLGRQDEW